MIPCIACSPRRIAGNTVTVPLAVSQRTQERVTLCPFHARLFNHYWYQLPPSARSATNLWRFIELEVYRYSLERILQRESKTESSDSEVKATETTAND